jgi:CRISPR-associated protein Csb2
MQARFQTRYELKPTTKEPNRKVAAGQIFAQPRKPRFRQVAYDSPPVHLLFDLVGEIAVWRLDRVVELTEHARDVAAQRLKDKLPDQVDKIHSSIVGRRDAEEADKAARLRITPIPSIGHRHADRAIRRILIEVLPNCPLRTDDLEWAFSGPLLISEHGEILCELAVAAERSMLAHYGIDDGGFALWRTVTPAALPQIAARRRMDPMRGRAEAKNGVERAEEEQKAAASAVQALRHAGVSARPTSVRVQREPFEAKGARAEAFALGTRFAKERLWHVEIAVAEAILGPIVIGDGRYLGLGIMAPVKDAWRDVMMFSVPADARVAVGDAPDLLRATRRALMARSRDDGGSVPLLFSGHEIDGRAASSGQHQHVFLASADADGDGIVDRLIVAAPWACDRSVRGHWRDRARFDRIVSSLETVRAGKLGVIELGSPVEPGLGDGLIGPATIWKSRTPYRPTRHASRRQDLTVAVSEDVIAECEHRGLPRPEIELLKLAAGPRGGDISASLRLRFGVVVRGPILLGRDSHFGGGLFRAEPASPDVGVTSSTTRPSSS